MKVDCGIIQLPLDALSHSPPKHPQRLTKTTIQDPRYGNVLWVFFVQKRAEIGGRSFFCRSEWSGNETV